MFLFLPGGPLHLERHPRAKEAFVSGLVSFQRAQCYFSSTVQTATLILICQTLRNTGALLDSDDFSDLHSKLLNTSALLVLATSGFIPIAFGLTSITLVTRESWHLITMSFITFTLATATLSIVYHYDRQYGKLDDYYNPLQNDGYIDYGTCAIGGNVGGTLFPLCGSSLLNSNAISSRIITKWWVWATWANCMTLMLSCFFSKLMGGRLLKVVRSRIDSALTRHSWMGLLGKVIGRLHGRIFFYVVKSLLSFGVQFYLIADFSTHAFFSYTWSFGQIIAVTVWVPSICECFGSLFFEYGREVFSKCCVTCTHGFEDWLSSADERVSKPEYPSPLEIMRDVVQQTVAMANYRPIGRPNHAASSDSDPEAVPLQSLSSAVDSHGTGPETQQQEIVIENSVRPAQVLDD